jgi:CBS domain containing-hemolysin-like protein
MSIEMSLLIIIITLLGNAFFVGAEFALVSARRSSIELMALEGSRTARITLRAMEQVSLMLAGAQLGVTLCSLIFGAAAEPLVAHALGGPLQSLGIQENFIEPMSFVIALILMVYVHVVIGEMVPKNLSLAKSSVAALYLVPTLFYIVKILRPIIATLNMTANGTLRVIGIRPRSEIKSSFDHDEIAGFVKESHREGLLSKEEERLLSGALDLEDRTIEHITLPLNTIVLTSPNPTPAEIEKLCAQTGFSRFPVPTINGDLDGYIHLNDRIPKRFIRTLSKIKANSSLRDTLATMQRSGSHIAEVRDERNKTTGIVMLEDVLEELVGPIRDETDKRQLRTR